MGQKEAWQQRRAALRFARDKLRRPCSASSALHPLAASDYSIDYRSLSARRSESGSSATIALLLPSPADGDKGML